MARKRSMYGKKRKINYGRILLLILLLAVLVGTVALLLRKDDYMGVIEEVLKSDISEITGAMYTVSDVDITVYSKDGIRYTNQHENIKKVTNFGGATQEDKDKSNNIKMLFDNLVKSKDLISQEVITTKDLPLIEDGYYWVDADFTVHKERLFLSDEEDYNFDLYYDIENKKVYIKEEYFTEFSTKNNKQNFKGYEVTEEFVKIIEELAK